MTMQISEAGIQLIMSFEGLRLKAYDDGVGVWTIGYGNTRGVEPGDVITRDEAENLLQDDLDDFERCVNQSVLVPLTQHQFDALVSFSFNVGCGALRRSTLLRKLNAGDYTGAADQLLRWNRGGGRALRGLTRRRDAERSLFLSEPEADDDDIPGAAAFPYPPEQKAEDPTDAFCDEHVIKPGDYGLCVKRIQRALNKWAEQSNMLNKLKVDGVFGPVTRNTIDLFQRRNPSLAIDRIVGPKTWAALEPYL